MEGLDFLVGPAAWRLPADWRRERVRHGLSLFRKAWWLQSRFEPYRALRRYARLLDWALAEPGYRPTTAVAPERGRLVALRFGHLGDLLHLLPVMEEIRRQRSDLRIELLTGPWNRALESQLSLFDAVHYFAPDIIQFHRGDRTHVLPPEQEKNWIRKIRGEGVDVVFCPSVPHLAELSIMIGLQAAHYVGCEWPIRPPVAGVLHKRAFDSRLYELDAVAAFLPDLGLQPRAVELRYRVPDHSAARAWGLMREAGLKDREFIAVFPGAGWRGKCWPPERFAAALDAVVLKTRAGVALFGNQAERPLCEAICDAMKSGASNMAGFLTVDESAALIDRSALVLCNDSAPLHIAAALVRPTVSLWGPTFPEKWAPRGGMHRIVAREGACAGCVYWHPTAHCVGTPPCMQTIEVDRVVSAMIEVLNNGGSIS